MMDVLGIAIETLVALAYVLVGALEVRRAHRAAGALFVTAGALVFLMMCGWRVALYGGLTSSSEGVAIVGTVYGLLRGVAMAGLLLSALVMLARKLDRLRGPARF